MRAEESLGVSQVRATLAMVQPGPAIGVLNPMPGALGITTWQASSAAVGPGVGERSDHVEEVGERPGEAVAEEDRRRVGVRRADMNEVDGLSVDLGEKVPGP